MITANLISDGSYQTIRLPKEFQFTGINQVAIRKRGNTIIITPIRKSWKSFAILPQADADFLLERPDILDFDRVI
jgi:antitoxin VapB